MTGLLVSVRNAHEASEVIEAGVDLLDVKEPRGGSLGAADNATLAEVGRIVRGRVPWSAALGELLDWQPRDVPRGLSFAKWGLAGCARHADWEGRWRAARAGLESTCVAVGVIYADWRDVDAPDPATVLLAARRAGCGALLIDTALKNRGRLLDHLSVAEVARLVSEAHGAGMRIVLAGSLDESTAERLLPLGPDLLAVRGAVCHGERTSRLDPRRVARWVARLRGTEHFELESTPSTPSDSGS